MSSQLKEVLHAYHIKPIVISKVSEKLYHVRDGIQEYALKKSDLDHKTIRHWEAIYRFSIHHNIGAVLPVYLTKDGKLYHRYNQEFYYVSPWINQVEEERGSKWITNFYTTLAKLHLNTKREHKMEMEKISEQFQTFLRYCKEIRENLVTLVSQFERNPYMSPLELLVCTHFRDVEKAFIEIDKRVNRFINDHEDGQITWASSLCHRNLDTSHIKGDFFVNWESARVDHPVMDLIQFFNREIGEFNPHVDQYIELFSNYMDINKLSLQELQFFAIYMLSPADYMQAVQSYVTGKNNESMVNTMKKLQHKYRKVLFGINWSNYIEKEHETLNFR